MEYSYKRISSSNIKDVVYLMKSVRNSAKPIAYYQKKFKTDFVGVSYIGYLAYAPDGEPAAFYGVFPIELIKNQNKVLACQSGDTVTNPKHQRQGLFIKLAQLTYSLAKQNGIQLVFGFPNQNSATGFFNRLNWIQSPRFELLEFHYKNSNIYNIFHRISIISPVYSLYLKIIKGIYKGSFSQFMEHKKESFVLNRTSEYYNYKMNLSNSHILKINGFIFWFKLEDGIQIGNVNFSGLTNLNIDKYRKALKKLARLLGVKKISIYHQQSELLDLLKAGNSTKKAEIYSGHLPLEKDNLYDICYSYSDLDTF